VLGTELRRATGAAAPAAARPQPQEVSIVSVAVAHQASSPAKTVALQQAAREAKSRGTELAVLHVVENLDLDVEEAYRSSLTDEIEAALKAVEATGVVWRLHLDTAREDVAETIMNLTKTVRADLLVIGARRRSPLGKFLLGSVTQTLILESDLPVLVVKSAA
jgi:nucleotide-binding universal stress UspA family protein